MAHQETMQLTCPHCRHAFTVEMRRVLDLGRDPTLRERFLRGEINVARCPQAGCGFVGFVPAPLAVHDPHNQQVLFLIPSYDELSPAKQRAAEGELGDALMTELERVPAADYFFKPVVVTGPAELAAALSPPSVPPNFGGEVGEGVPEQDEGGGEGLTADVPLELEPILRELSQPACLSDMPRRMELCRQGLALVSREQNPPLWAALQNALGNSLAQNPLGHRAENLERAIQHYQQALEVYTRPDFPTDWAMTQNNLATAYRNRIRGDRAENLERAIQHYRQALEVYTRETFPEQWAMTRNNLGNAYVERIRGERAENLERAIHHYQQALEVYTHDTFPELWAGIQDGLGIAYCSRIQGERAENLERAIHHLQQALEVRTRDAFPEQWAMTRNNLGNAYSNRIRGNRAENLDRAIHHFEQALQVFTRDAFPERWATVQVGLGNTFDDRIRGNRAENLERAIYHLKQALEIYTFDAFPEQWAITQRNLAAAYYSRIRGNRAENLEQAIHHYQQALEVRARDAFPEQWAAIQNGLSNVYSDRIRGERAENLERAIHHLEQALEIYTFDAFPDDWATTQLNLGAAYSDRIRGERAENLEQAIHHLQQALQVYTRDSFPEQWANTQNNLGVTYSDRIRGYRAENIERGIHHYQKALQVYTRDAFPERWALLQNNLGATYSDRIQGERAENLEQAIRHFQQALQVYTRATFPEQWAMTQNNLGVAYRNRIRGDRAENIERAIQHCQQALMVYTREAFLEKWATAQHRLGNAYFDRIRGDRAENIERVIYHHQQALEVCTRDAFPEPWATIQNNLGLAYRNRIRGEGTENLEQAILHFQQALEVRTRDAFPEQWATTRNNLGNAYLDRIRGERAENIERAIHHFQQALEVRTHDAFPRQWAMTQISLGNAYADRIRGERAENLEEALHHLQQASKVFTREAFPEQWAATQNNLGNAYRNRIRGDRAENLERAIQHYQQALEVYTPEAFPERAMGTGRNLGDVYYDQQAWREAYNAYDHHALPALETLYGYALGAGRPRILGQQAGLFERATLAALRAGRPREAAELAERSRARSLLEAMVAREVLPQAVEPALAQAYFERANRVTALERAFQAAEQATTPEAQSHAEGLRQELLQARTELRETWEQVRHALAVEPLGWAGLRQAASEDGAVVVFRITGEGTWAFLIGPWSPAEAPVPEDVIAIPQVTQETLARWLGEMPAPVDGWVEAWSQGDHDPILQDLAASEGMYTAGWFIAYGLRRATLFARGRAEAQREATAKAANLAGLVVATRALHQANAAEKAAKRAWHDTIERLAGELHTALLAPVLARLEELRAAGQPIRRLTFIPHGGLHLLPLHAAWWPDADGTRRDLADEYVVGYAPAGAVLARCRERWEERLNRVPSLVAISNPTGDLLFAGQEAEVVLSRFQDVGELLSGPEATREAVLDRLPGARYGHYAGHAYFDLEDPLNAGLVLADGRLTLAEVLAQITLPETLLMTLSGCETQQVAPGDPADEYVGLPAGFLIAGAAAVAGSLWLADDLATAWLMERFYDGLLDAEARPRCTPAEALRAAQRWLRDLPLAQVETRLRGEIARAEQAGEQRRAGTLKDLLAEVQERGDPPFRHPVWWAGFAAAGR